MNTWLFFDWWHIEHQDNVELCQGTPKWVPEATYEDPYFDNLFAYTGVWKEESGRWLMVYPACHFPTYISAAESEDGIHWKPLNCPNIVPDGGKQAPNHIFTLLSSNGGPPVVDPIASDGYRFRFFAIQRGGEAAKHAKLDPHAPFHEVVCGEGAKPYLARNVILRSQDGLHWEIDEEATWEFPGWHPDPFVSMFKRESDCKLVIVTRPGWGDRRLVTLASADGRRWEEPDFCMQPDILDPPGTQFYAMSPFAYEGKYVSFLSLANFANSEPLARFNQLFGTNDAQLAFSYDGKAWQRGFRKPFMPLNDPGQPGSGAIFPTVLIDMDDRLRIYSSSSLELHMQHSTKAGVPKGTTAPTHFLMHELRRDGFMYLQSKGNWARLISKPMALKKPELLLNILAPHGELTAQITDMESNPIEGFTYADAVPFKQVDAIREPLAWKNAMLDTLLNRPVRLEIKFRHARIFAIRGDFHFLDALDVAFLNDGKQLMEDRFDF